MVEAYSYDANGNRLTSTNSAGTFAATYDDQDRIETYGSIEYTFTLNGELLNRTDTATNESTDFVYDAMGNLREVTLPNGDVIEYLRRRRAGAAGRQVLQRRAGALIANVSAVMVTPTSTYRIVRTLVQCP